MTRDEFLGRWVPGHIRGGLVQARAELDALLAAQREADARVADQEEEPAEGEMPPEIIERVLAGDTAYVELALLAAVRATKKSIAAAIRDSAELARTDSPAPDGLDEEAFLKFAEETADEFEDFMKRTVPSP